MKISNEEYQIIEEFITDSISDERRMIFEKLMDREDFREEVSVQLSLLSEFQNEKNNKIKNEIASFKEDFDLKEAEKASSKSSFTSKILKLLALIMLLVALGFLFNKFRASESKVDAIYAEMYESFPAVDNKRGKLDEEIVQFNNSMEFYKKRDFKNCLIELNKLDVNSPTRNLYKAACHLELEQYAEAKSSLNLVLSSDDQELKQVAEWYDTLLLLKTNEEQGFTSSLNKIISNKNHLFYSKAIQLQKKL